MDVILNWLWQGGIVGLAAAGVLRVIPPSRTQARYCFIWTACVVVSALPTVPAIVAAAAPVPAANQAATLGPALSLPITWWTSVELAIGLWVIWCGVYAARIVAAAVALLAAKAQSRECPPGIEARLHHWSRVKASGRRTRIVLSTRVRAAAVLGCGSPLIALAPALLDRLSDADLDRVVIHEWAHVQRRDDIAQFVQRLVRIIAGWHPAVWWLERQLELEREVACDEIAVAVTGSAKQYAACLATLAALPSGLARPVSAPAAVSSSGLRRRLVRILAYQCVSRRPWRTIAAGASVVLATFALVVGNVSMVEAAATSLSLRVAAPPTPTKTIAGGASTTPRSVQEVGSFSNSATPRGLGSLNERRRPARRNNNAPDTAAAMPANVESPASVVAAMLPQWPPDGPTSGPVETLERSDVPVAPLEAHSAFAADAPPEATYTPAAADVKGRAPWSAAADAGVAIGRGSRNLGVATAGFFNRFGKKIAASF